MIDLQRFRMLSDEQREEVQLRCEEFAQSLQNGASIRIEDCLTKSSQGVQRILFQELLALELARQFQRDERPQLGDYQSRFPDFFRDIEQVVQQVVKSRPADALPSNTGGARTEDKIDPGVVGRGNDQRPLGLTSVDGGTTLYMRDEDGRQEYTLAALSVPGYEIESVLGYGGMGVVYKARHLKLKRTVALKMVLAGEHAGPRDQARFRIEAEAVARLQHPNIVQIHEVGEAGGIPYCALEFVDGGNLASKLNGQPMPATEATSLVESLARAMQLAHSRNVVHRDLKPANILLTADGTPKVTDFGLARQLDSDSNETLAGTLVGTPAFMAPEQALGLAHEAGPAADVYALGAILYYCLAGRPPFEAQTVVEMLDRVRTEQPSAPSRWQPSVPLDLETICLKCLRKEPEHRYASASELADELVRFQQGKPILARPVPRLERAAKWVKRNPGAAVSMAVIAGTFLTAFALVSWSYWNAEIARRDEAQQRRAADSARVRAQGEQRAERWGRYRSNIAAAAAALQLQNNIAAGNALDDAPEEHRDWEWRYVHCQLDGASHVFNVPGGRIDSLVLSPSGRQVAVGCFGHKDVYLYDLATTQLQAVLRGHMDSVTSVAYRPDGNQLATASNDQTIRLWDPATGQQVALLQAGVDPTKLDRNPLVTYNADGTRIASYAGSDGGAGTNRLWDAATGKEIAVLAEWQEFSNRVAFSPDGQRVAAGSKEFVYLRDASSGRQIARLGPHGSTVWLLQYSPDGKRIASATAPGSNDVSLWDGESGSQVAILSGHANPVDTMAFSPDGSRLVSWGDYPDFVPRLWDTADGRLLSTLVGHKNRIQWVAFSSDGQRVVTSSTDRTARIWDGRTGKSLGILNGHTDQVPAVTFSPDGTRLVTASNDATLRLWDSSSGDLIGVLRGHAGEFRGHCAPVFTPDGARLVSGSGDGTLRIWDMSLAERNGILRGHEGNVYDVAFSPDGEQVASVAWDGTARLWNATTGRQAGVFKHETGIVTSVAFNRDGSRVATVERERGVSLWDIATRQATHAWRVPAGYWGADPRVAFNPDATIVAAGCFEGPIRLWSVASGQEIAQLSGHKNTSISVDFHPDSRLLASAGEDGTVRLWELETQSEAAVLRGHNESVWQVAFSADGKLLASGSNDKTIRLWDIQSEMQVAAIAVGSVVYGVAFSPDGKRVAAGCRDNTVRLFDVASRQQVAELQGHTDFVHAVAWSPDGTRLVSGSGDFTLRVWDSMSAQERMRRASTEH